MIHWGVFQPIFQADTRTLLRELLPETLEAYKYQLVTDGDNYLIGVPTKDTANQTPICMVAHCDTIARKGVRLVTRGCTLTNTYGVLGADDRAGVYAICHLLETTGKRPYIIFTNYEEAGCKGVQKMVADKAFDPYAEQITLFVEPDRRGSEDYVFYSAELPEEIGAFARTYGYKKAYGSTSDVRHLTVAYKRPHLNLSIGYYDQHSPAEHLKLDELAACMVRMSMMLYSEEVPDIRMREDQIHYKSRSFDETKWERLPSGVLQRRQSQEKYEWRNARKDDGRKKGERESVIPLKGVPGYGSAEKDSLDDSPAVFEFFSCPNCLRDLPLEELSYNADEVCLDCDYTRHVSSSGRTFRCDVCEKDYPLGYQYDTTLCLACESNKQRRCIVCDTVRHFVLMYTDNVCKDCMEDPYIAQAIGLPEDAFDAILEEPHTSCPECGLVGFASQGAYETHVKTFHSKKEQTVWTCLCGRVFDILSHFRVHEKQCEEIAPLMQVEVSEEPFCRLCGIGLGWEFSAILCLDCEKSTRMVARRGTATRLTDEDFNDPFMTTSDEEYWALSAARRAVLCLDYITRKEYV